MHCAALVRDCAEIPPLRRLASIDAVICRHGTDLAFTLLAEGLPLTTCRTAMQEDEILSVARFKIGDTARRVAILAESASDPAVREALLALVVALLAEQRALTYRSRSAA